MVMMLVVMFYGETWSSELGIISWGELCDVIEKQRIRGNAPGKQTKKDFTLVHSLGSNFCVAADLTVRG